MPKPNNARRSGAGSGKGGAGRRAARGGQRVAGQGQQGRGQQNRSYGSRREVHASGKPSVPRATSYIEGRRAIAEALDARVPLRRALVQASLAGDAGLSPLIERLERSGVRVEETPKSHLDKLSSHGAHQGIIAETRPFSFSTLADVYQRAGEGSALVAVLDHVTDEGNFGAIVRSAEVAGAAGVVIANARAAKVGVGAYKTSAGAIFHIPIVAVPNLPAALEDLKEHGFWVAGASEHATQTCYEAPFEGRIALVMGSEGAGISQLVQKKCDFLCKLPQRGITESLNVAQAFTALAFEWLRRDALLPASPLEAELDAPFGDDFDLGGDRMNDGLPAAGNPGATGMFQPVYAPGWDADDFDIGS